MGQNKSIEKTVQWLRDKVSETKTQGLLVGVSGGLDSAVVAFLIKKAMPDASLGIVLPCESGEQDIKDAIKTMKACNIASMEIDLTFIHNELIEGVFKELKGLGRHDNKDLNKIAKANLKARLRMSTLYTVANALNYLVVGTDNAAEIHVGYFTKYGDGGVDVLPIAHLTKRRVGEWAKALGVPGDIIKKVPTAGLWEGQTDEKEMGTTYDMVDDLLEGKKIAQKDELIIGRLHNTSRHKRNLPASPPREWYIR